VGCFVLLQDMGVSSYETMRNVVLGVVPGEENGYYCYGIVHALGIELLFRDREGRPRPRAPRTGRA
jgi:hypothetical protein